MLEAHRRAKLPMPGVSSSRSHLRDERVAVRHDSANSCPFDEYVADGERGSHGCPCELLAARVTFSSAGCPVEEFISRRFGSRSCLRFVFFSRRAHRPVARVMSSSSRP